MKTHKNKEGFALTEVLLSIALIIIVGVGGMMVYSRAKLNSQVESLANNLTAMNQSITNMYERQDTFQNISMEQMDKAGLVPEALKDTQSSWGQDENGNWVQGSTTVYVTPWKGDVNLYATLDDASTTVQVYHLQITNVPPEACVKFVQRMAPAAYIIYAGQEMVKKSVNWGNKLKDQIDQTALLAGCQRDTNGQNPLIDISYL